MIADDKSYTLEILVSQRAVSKPFWCEFITSEN